MDDTERQTRAGPTGDDSGGHVWLSLGAEGVLAAAAVFGLWVASLHSYLLFHSIVEVAFVAMAVAVFVMAWHLRSFVANGYALTVGIGLLCTSAVQITHMLAYEGMGVFPGEGGNLAIQLWIASRYLTVATFLVAPFSIDRRVREKTLWAGFGLAAVLLLAAILWWRVFPTCYVDGVGLTPFKRVSEYAVAALFVVAAALVGRRGAGLGRATQRMLVAAMLLFAISGLAFTLYVGLYTFFNLAGHLLMLVAVYLVYRGVVTSGMALTYTRLVGELEEKSGELRFLSLRDELTGLYNRRGFVELAEQQMRFAHRDRRNVVLVFGDVDGLKAVNDRLGHRGGDELLATVADSLRDSFRDADVVARIGGDEFAVLGIGVEPGHLDEMLQRFQIDLARREPAAGTSGAASMTLGAAFMSADAPLTLDELMRDADRAMYDRKVHKPRVGVEAPAEPR